MFRRKRHTFRTVMIAGLIAVWGPICSRAQVIQTPGEQVNFARYATYEEMMDYLLKIQAQCTEMVLSDFGVTIEGRQQPYVVFSRPIVTRPFEAFISGKPILVLAANVHGNEKTIRESLLILVREFAAVGSEMNKLLDKLVVLIAPSINPDGFVRNTRGNATGADLNRDYTKLEQPASRNYAQNILHSWHPHIYMDGHNDGSQPYNLCYQGPATALADQRLTDICDREIFPFIDKEMEAAGYRSWYYAGGNRQAWTGIPWAHTRSVINYGGVINSIAILFESPEQDPQDGVLSGLVACKALVKYVVQNPDKIMNLVNQARRETIELGQKARGQIPVQEELGPKDYKVSYLISEERGAVRKLVRVTNADLNIQPVILKSRPLPYAYILEPRAFQAVEFIKQHKVTIEVLQQATKLEVEAYQINNIEYKNDNQHPTAIAVTLADEPVKQILTFPAGSYVIRTGQVMGRIIAGMLEPETADNVVYWNTMDAFLSHFPPRPPAVQRAAGTYRPGPQRRSPPAIIPIFKLMTPTPLPIKILKY
ncbi:MAG: hypothetical protein AMJ79_13105 [Phycisphaerae bacterium SM23_30]|nr:MAG: hypothetical protein AMJ79_13105 [Phycisphaerae bacterium SM23_30]